MWSIRMRASKRAAKRRGQTILTPGTQSQITDVHISGAESICSRREIRKIVQAYVDRATAHPRGKPDSIVITIEHLRNPPKVIAALPVMTVKCQSSSRAQAIIVKFLRTLGVSEKAIASALQVLQRREAMRGASLVLASSGRRVEPDLRRGVRVSRFGTSRAAGKALSASLADQGIDTATVREALMLASKVASCRDILAEVCISDDPDYTTGYVASAELGYLRIPRMKKKWDRRGGRVFFLKQGADIPHVIAYLEKTPVIIHAISSCPGTKAADEIIDRHHQ